MIIVFGSVNLDLVAHVARLPAPGETIAGTSFAASPGGKGANQALAARRAGAVVAMAGAVGTDPFADKAMAGLVSANVNVAWVQRVAMPTGIAMIHVDEVGQNAITVIAGANAMAEAAVVPDAAFGSDTTLLLQLEVPVAEVSALATRARRAGARVVLNAAPASPLPSSLLATLDVLIVNAIEAASLAATLALPQLPEEFAVAAHRRLGLSVVVTLGQRGIIAATGGAFFRAAAPTVNVVDTTGAGDAFAGVLTAALDRGAGWQEAISEGVAAGSLACTVHGAQPALPGLVAIRELATKVASTLTSRPLQ